MILEKTTNMYNPQYDVITDLNTIKDLNNTKTWNSLSG